jgi:hypothetical protein
MPCTVHVVAGTGAGQTRDGSSIASDQLTCSAFATTLDATSVVVVLAKEATTTQMAARFAKLDDDPTTPLEVNVVEINDQTVTGDGSTGDPWTGAT